MKKKHEVTLSMLKKTDKAYANLRAIARMLDVNVDIVGSTCTITLPANVSHTVLKAIEKIKAGSGKLGYKVIVKTRTPPGYINGTCDVCKKPNLVQVFDIEPKLLKRERLAVCNKCIVCSAIACMEAKTKTKTKIAKLPSGWVRKTSTTKIDGLGTIGVVMEYQEPERGKKK